MSDPVARLNAALSGRYRVERELGEGGMATVYLADDLRHERRVALKVLKPELAAVVGAERFLSEIKTTANLQHPHILPLFDSGEADGFLFYVMPYVEGETLRDRLDREKQLPIDEAVSIATAVAGALDHAHRHGVVHRDIKPANILLQDGQPVVGDFGIALAVGAAGGPRLTETGLSVGTPYYMSPEQATGDQVVGPPSDVYALGAVLYEMLTGDPPYMGSTAQAVLGQIITGDPVAATKKRRSIPAHVDAAVRKALERLPADRFTDAGSFAQALGDPTFRHGNASQRLAAVGAGPWKRLSAATAVAAVVFAGVAAWALLGRSERARHVERFSVPFLHGQELTGYTGIAGYTLSPDGTMLVYRHDPGTGQVLMVRRWDELTATPVRDSRGALFPAVSPDGRELLFQQAGDIKALAFAGGPVRTLVKGTMARWGPDGFVYASTDSGIVRVPAEGGAAQYVSRLAEEEGAQGVWDMLPDGRHALVMIFPKGNGQPEIRALDLRTGKMRSIVAGIEPRYLPPDRLLYLTTDQNPTLMAARFDAKKMGMLGTPVALMDAVASFSLSDDGKLFYTTGSLAASGARNQVLQPIWVTRTGKVSVVDSSWTFAAGGPDLGWRISPNGTMVANRQHTADGNDIWVKHLPHGPLSRLTFSKAEDRQPVWAPGGRDVTFISTRSGHMDVWSKPADGTSAATLVVHFARPVATADWSPDGKWLLLRTAGPQGAVAGRDIYAFRPGTDSVPTPLLADTAFDEMYPDVSPDGRFLAYETTATGRDEIYVRPFPDVNAGRWQVSVDGGRYPRWAHDGREVFFQGPDQQMMVVDVKTTPTFSAGTPRMLFKGQPGWAGGDITGDVYDVAPDDQRFLMARVVSANQLDTAVTSVLVNNFSEELNSRLRR